MSETKF